MNKRAYPEPYKLPAALLALVVHALFFAMLYFGFNWHTQPPQGMVVKLWSSLPDAKPSHVKKEAQIRPQKVEPPKPVEKPKLVEPPKPVEKPKPVEQPKPKIEIKAKAKPPAKPKPPEPPKPKPELKPAPKVDVKAEQQAAAERAAAAAAAAAQGRLIDEYIGRIRAKIRSNIVMPPDVADNALAIFDVTLLPDGSVLVVQLKKSSGNDTYDRSVNNAIYKSQPLPLPPDVNLFQTYFRNLELKFKPKE